MNKFTAGMLAGTAVGMMGLIVASDRSLRRKIMNKSEDIIEKAESIGEKCMMKH